LPAYPFGGVHGALGERATGKGGVLYAEHFVWAGDYEVVDAWDAACA